jgi:signal transduction histidine kinase
MREIGTLRWTAPVLPNEPPVSILPSREELAMTILRPSPPNPSQRQWELRRQCNHALDELRRSHEELDHFVRALSHDMTANFMLLEASFGRLKGLLEDPPRADRQEAVTHVEACLRESKRFLEDLVGLAKTGNVQMEPARVEVGRVLDEVLFEQRELLAQRNVRVDVRRPIPAVWCNEHRLKQVLTNLIRNAIRHGCDPERPQITVSTAESRTGRTGGQGQRMVWLRVYDNGPGIGAEHLEEVFLPGRRLADAAGDGSGMGLAIARKVVEYYGGAIHVDPDCHDGTAMVFSLPAGPEVGTAMPPGERRDLAEAAGRCLGRDAPHEEAPGHRHQPLHQSRGPRSQP